MHEWTGVGGKRVVLTGATNGIGLAGAKRLVRLGAEVAIVARSPERAKAALSLITSAQPDSAVDVFIADLSAQDDVRRLAAEIRQRYDHLDVLINNAGAVYSSRQLTRDGIEVTWALNHLAPFLLTTMLLDLLTSSPPARIITTSSAYHQSARIPFDDLNADRGYGAMGYDRYGQTKLANILFTSELARRTEGTGVTANCFHPGFVNTGFGTGTSTGGWMRALMRVSHLFARPPDKGAETLVWLADAPEVAHISGWYFVDQRLKSPSAAARDPEAARRLWVVSEQQTGT
jgi:NAD(P)-dependent dehydrogenase (short-subunit alcohol dehydrogenase family)